MKVRLIFACFIASLFIVACSEVTETEHQAASDIQAVIEAPRIQIGGVYDGQLVESDTLNITYKLNPAQAGNVGMLYVDNGDPQPLQGLEGEYEITGLEPGVHAIQIKEMTEDFEHTGYFDQVNFIVQ